MGTWGFEIFEDDLALDIKDEFEELLANGETIPSATKTILKEYEDDLEDTDWKPIIFMALAKLQIQNGKLQKNIKNKVLRILEDEEHLQSFKEMGIESYTKRKEITEKLKEQILSFQDNKQIRNSRQARSSGARKKAKLRLGDVFEFDINQEEIEMYDNDIPSEVRTRSNKGYGIVVNIKERGATLVELKRINTDTPSVSQIVNGYTVNYKWVLDNIIQDESYRILDNIVITPVEFCYWWFVKARDRKKFLVGEEVDILITEINNPVTDPSETIEVTKNVSILKELYRDDGVHTPYSLKVNYLLSYNRDENDISTLKY